MILTAQKYYILSKKYHIHMLKKNKRRILYIKCSISWTFQYKYVLFYQKCRQSSQSFTDSRRDFFSFKVVSSY